MPLALTIAFALMMSFFVSRTVTPLLCLYMLKGHLGEAERGAARRDQPGARRASTTPTRAAWGGCFATAW